MDTVIDFSKLDPRFAAAKTSSGAVLGVKPPAAKAPSSAKGGKAKKLTKKELRMIQRQKEAAARLQVTGADDQFGDLKLIQSTQVSGKSWTRLSDISPSMAGKDVWVRARVHTVRAKGKLAFVLLRQSVYTMQAAAFQSKEIPKALLKYIEQIPRESVVDVLGHVQAVDSPITSATQSDVELHIKKIFTVSKAEPSLPFQLEDASRADSLVARADEADDEDADAAAGDQFAAVSQNTRLDNRWIDLRTPANQAIFRISSTVCTLFREFLLQRNFVEIQTPKLLGGASEGGSSVFNLKYFGQDACLAQSPQLYKQMCAACSDFERVFEIGPVFRAENSNTHRHLCEFHGLDMEMAINEHYYEVLDVFSDLFIFMFDELNKRCKDEIEAVRAQHPFEDLVYTRPSLRITYAEGIALLREAGIDISDHDDLSTPNEKLLGKLVKEKYGTEFFMMDKYPLSVRPFYTMPCPEDASLSNSYDFFIRGEEILSGAQRVHDPELLAERAAANDIPLHTIQGYVDSFKHGALPHGGGGVGLERVVMLFLGLPNIRKSSLFPRDPRRLTP